MQFARTVNYRARTQSQSNSFSSPTTELQGVQSPSHFVQSPSLALTAPPQTPVSLQQPIQPPAQMALEKRRPLKAQKKVSKRRVGNSQVTTKDLGRWKPIDDLALIIGIQQTNDIRMVHRGTKFSCKFTVQEMQSRWYSLLYEEPISRIAVAAMRNLHPEMIESIQSRALYSVAEEEILGTIKSTESPTLEVFQELLEKNSHIFYQARTPKHLYNYWELMKQYQLLPDQVVTSLSKGEGIHTFSEAEDLINDTELNEGRDEALEIELALTDRKNKREIRQLENELSRWNVLVDSLTGIGFIPDFDNQTLAIIRGRLVRFLMRSREACAEIFKFYVHSY
jgi:microspherule protein 1